MNRIELTNLHADLCDAAKRLMAAKNQDYAASSDPFRNFRTFGSLGIVVRLSDKIARLHSFCERGTLSVADESIRDTVLDIINYAVLFQGYLEDEKQKAAGPKYPPGALVECTEKELKELKRRAQ